MAAGVLLVGPAGSRMRYHWQVSQANNLKLEVEFVLLVVVPSPGPALAGVESAIRLQCHWQCQ